MAKIKETVLTVNPHWLWKILPKRFRKYVPYWLIRRIGCYVTITEEMPNLW